MLYLALILRQLRTLTERINDMASSQQDLDAAIADVSAKLDTLSTDLAQGIQDLEAKIAASGTTADFSAEVANLKAVSDKLDAATTSITAADPGAPATPPATT